MPKRKDIKKIMVIGSGPIVIGQAAEFDYAGTQACLALKEEGYEVILVNSNPATIMTDTTVADKVYMEPLTLEYVAKILRFERPDALIPGLGGQTGLNLAMQLEKKGVLSECQVELLGTSAQSIECAEDREKFKELCESLGEPVLPSMITHSAEEAVSAAMDRIEGAYSLVLSSPTKLIAARDPHGFRPLCMGHLKDGSVVFASESCALDAIGAEFERDIRPGEIVVVDTAGVRSDTSHCGKAPKKLCVFEFIYFARPDSVIDGSSVHVARQRAGAFLALEHPVQADVVIGVPDSGLDAALGYARQSGIPYGIGFIKNKYIGRTFISPTQTMRENEVNIKLNPIRSVVEGKRVVLIDDSIVRGTTCRRTIDLLWKAGAKEIHMRVSAPPFVSECYYGTDIDDKNNLIATHHTVDEIAKIIGVNSLGYLSIEDVVKLADNTENGFCTACFGGGYPTSIPKDGGKDRFECKISEGEKKKNA